MFKFIALFYIVVNSHSIKPKVTYYDNYIGGEITSSGESYMPNTFTCASPYLPFNTYVKITNVENDSTVIVRVNDRAPYKVDITGVKSDKPMYHFILSDWAFTELYGKNEKVKTVKYEILTEEEVSKLRWK